MSIKNKKSTSKGFTLIELVVVIGILAVLLAIVLIAINPAKQFKQANDTKRRSDVNAILNAVGQYAADNKGNLPAGIPIPDAAASPPVVPLEITGGTIPNLCSLLSPEYISAIPADPTIDAGAITNCATTGAISGYTVSKDASGRVTVAAPLASPVISVMR